MLSLLKKYLTTPRTTEPLRKILDDAEAGRISVPALDTERCDGCEACAAFCPTKALVHDGPSQIFRIDGELCIRCGRCIAGCRKGALAYGHLLPVAARRKESFQQVYVLSAGKFALRPAREERAPDVRDGADMQAILKRSLLFRELDSGSCNACEVEVNLLTSTYYDVERFGISSTASPRFADAVLITGPVSRNMKEACERTYKAVPAPKIVIAMGSCAISGGIYRGSYAVEDGADRVMPVHVYVPGCPPSPAALIYGMMMAMSAA
jgi:Ni,Fe-hydrogenase III small subunit/formate hydrogenlyase subunit 6/NADH:ubiquinone oxidoreductase subunit I